MRPIPDEPVTEARNLLRKHFPDVDWTKHRLSFHAYFLNEGWLNAGSLVSALEEKKEMDRLKRIEKLAADLWREYHALPLKLRADRLEDGDNRDIWRRLMRLTYDLTGKTPLVSFGASEMPQKKGAVGKMRDRMGDFFKMHHTQRVAEMPKKVHLAHYCYDLWYDLRGEHAPKAPSAGAPFHEFVGAVIDHAGKDWSVERTLKQYHAFKDG